MFAGRCVRRSPCRLRLHGKRRGAGPIQTCGRLLARTRAGHGRLIGSDRASSQGVAPASEAETSFGRFKSSHSGGNTTECVKASFTAHGTAVRNSKTPTEEPIRFGRRAWIRLLSAAQVGQCGPRNN
ncbi:DUF397 domain-containing protein [Streptomyces sp. NPDC059819]|uniref:DUF397 domain-containing protein n=1 Tax=Streptomyces sp. NPDC059819 TaxID=3346963 RepID=UPI003669AA23